MASPALAVALNVKDCLKVMELSFKFYMLQKKFRFEPHDEYDGLSIAVSSAYPGRAVDLIISTWGMPSSSYGSPTVVNPKDL